jgi:hypothetical protein
MKRITRFRKRTWVLLGVVAVIAAMASVGAYAYWTSTGSGTGSATVGTDTPWEVTTAAATGGPLTPDGPAQSIDYTVTNNSTGTQRLANVAISVANANGSAWDGPGTCSAADFEVNGAAAGTAYDDTSLAGDFAAAADDTAPITIQMIDTGANQNDCRGVTVPLYLFAS